MKQIQIIGVAGAGAMGRGIAQIAAQAGFKVRLFDTQAAVVASAREALAKTWDTLAGKGKIKPEQAQAAQSNLVPAVALSELADCDLVIEAIIERLDIKQQFFRELEAVVRPDCILASNTSSLSVTAIASVCAHPERVVGYHFFNPVPLMKVV